MNGDSGLTLTVLGCGTMGVAILGGIMASLTSPSKPQSYPASTAPSGTATPTEELPPRLPSRFIACVRRPESLKKVRNALNHYDVPFKALVNDNLRGAQEADVVLLGCKPQMFRDILGQDGMREALAGKLLISILAGVTTEQLEEFLYGGVLSGQNFPPDRCRVVRAMPNTASLVRESMTVIATSTPPLDPSQSQLINWIFTRIGRVVTLPPTVMDASTALCGSGPAFMALVLEAIADGAVAMGLPRAEAQMMAAQTMRGTTGLVLNGDHPAILRDKVSTPGGCTIGGLLVLEEGGVRGAVARAVREATVVAAQLGKGVTGVNGTRF
ncbi:delta 1-pyrroline-5-carboxylate reductase [Coniosporium apollinis]|uniref:Pyrroline-5-carboxylate reductase n=1 Tax=Coniosporium apollinis TaxID=61459 RepID=A0ABQ9NXG4_9PEZI|nr:delta 1-pyrroline-5-carboxylate reductase [Coniosporium apollinis]